MKSIRLILCFAFLGLPLSVQAVETTSSDSEIGYESIISELSKSKARPFVSRAETPSVLETAKIHSGVGFAQSFLTFDTQNSGRLQGIQKGVQATLGIDLFSRNWFAEGAIRSFGESDVENVLVRLREFDLKVVYRSEPMRLIGYRAGIGLAARNLRIIENGSEQKFSTPASIFLVGVDTNISNMVSLGGEVSYRSSMVSDSNDRNSIDVAIKLDAHF